jgi:hypothetical protein
VTNAAGVVQEWQVAFAQQSQVVQLVTGNVKGESTRTRVMRVGDWVRLISSRALSWLRMNCP